MRPTEWAFSRNLGVLKEQRRLAPVLADLKVTHCPVCDRPVTSHDSSERCYICQRALDADLHIQQVQIGLLFEIRRTAAMLTKRKKWSLYWTRNARNRLERECEHVRTEVLRLQSMLRPIRVAAAAVLPPEIGIIDMRIGQQQERVAQFDRIARSLSHREALTQEIETIQKETAALEAEVAQQSGLLEFDRASDRIQMRRMNSYLNEIKKGPHRGLRKKSRCELRRRDSVSWLEIANGPVSSAVPCLCIS